jgi:hypothetical protein
MMIRGVRVNQWLKQKSVQNLVRQVFPGTRVRMRNRYRGGPGARKYELWWAGNASDADMRELANEIEAALPAKAAGMIECRRIP